MDAQSFLTYLFDAIAFGYVALIILDLGNCLSSGLLDIFASSPAAPPLIVQEQTPVDLPSLHPADEGVLRKLTPLEMVAEERVSSLSIPLEAVAEERVSIVVIPLEVVADPWSVEVELTTKPCCCHTAAIATPLQLLLPPALEVVEQPDLATLPSSQLRKLCSERGIKWRGVHGGKHLSKPDMVAALSDRTTYRRQ